MHGRPYVSTALALSLATSVVVGSALTASAASKKKPFRPRSGLYEGPYTGGASGPSPVKIRVGQRTSSGVEVVNLEQFSAIATCGGGIKRPFSRQIVAARRGRSFSLRARSLAGTLTFSGRFTSTSTLTGTVRVSTRGRSPSQTCDTGNVSFRARRVAAQLDSEVSRMGDPLPPLFWMRDPEGNTLMVAG